MKITTADIASEMRAFFDSQRAPDGWVRVRDLASAAGIGVDAIVGWCGRNGVPVKLYRADTTKKLTRFVEFAKFRAAYRKEINT